MMTTRDVSATLRKVKMPPGVLTIGSGDPDELSEFITQLGYLAATCATTDRQISSTELAAGIAQTKNTTTADTLETC